MSIKVLCVTEDPDRPTVAAFVGTTRLIDNRTLNG